MNNCTTITLDTISLEYLDDIFQYSTNTDFCKYLSCNTNTTKDETQIFIEYLIDENSKGRRKYFTILLNNKAIGTIGFLNINEKSAELGFGISKEYWGQGIAQQAVNILLNYGFDEYNFNTIIVGTNILNIRTQKFIKKFKFKEYKETLHHKYYYLNKPISC